MAKMLNSKKKSKGFTLIEVLLAMAVLSFGISYIFPIFFNSSSSIKHIKQRIHADLIMENESWGMRTYLDQNNVPREHVIKRSIGTDPQYNLFMKAMKIKGTKGLYRLSMVISWEEGRRKIFLKRDTFIRKK